MKMRFSIFAKLLLVILPLVCAPVAVVGYFSVQASVERVDRLVRQEQMVQVRTAAGRINDLFSNARIDLQTIAGMPVLEDFHLARTFRLMAEAQFNQDSIVRLFREFMARSPHYHQIRCLDSQGRELIKVRGHEVRSDLADLAAWPVFQRARRLGPQEILISDLGPLGGGPEMAVHFAGPFFSGWRELAGVVVIDLDFQKISRIVDDIRVGQAGHAFLVDAQGRNIAHPRVPPYHYSLETYPDPNLRRMVEGMMAGSTGWGSYVFQGEAKVAAYAPIPAMRWSLAVTIPREEYGREAQAIQGRVLEVAMMTILAALAGAGVLAYNLVRPVRRLVQATHRLASGDLAHELPVLSHDELGELTDSFNRMVQQLSRTQYELVRSEKLVSLGRLSAGVAHEIRNPLNAMKGAIVHLQRRRPQDALLMEYTQLVLEEIDRLNRFVGDFLFFAKQTPPRCLPSDLNRLVRSIMSLYEEQAQHKGVTLHDRLDPDLPTVSLDPHQMEQVLVNLVVNARDAMPQGGHLTFSSLMLQGGRGGVEGGRVRLTLHDSGLGIPPRHLQSIFDPFFTTKDTGTGLGLTLSLGIVESHGGSLVVQSQPGQGTTVTLELPLEGPPPAEEEAHV